MKKGILIQAVIMKIRNTRLCLPKVIVFLQLLNNMVANYFDTIRNWDKEKNKLLEAYGYSLNDDLKGKFEFAYKDGKPFLRVLDPVSKEWLLSALPAKPVFIPIREKGIESPEDTARSAGQALTKAGDCF